MIDLAKCPIDGTYILGLIERRWRPNSDYAEISVALSNDTIMRTAVCKSCATSMTEAKSAVLIDKIRSHWFGDLVGVSSRKQLDEVQAITVVAVADNDKEASAKALVIKDKKLSDKLKESHKKHA